MATGSIVFALDESVNAKLALQWTAKNLLGSDSDIHICTVLPPISGVMGPAAPIATAVCMRRSLDSSFDY